MRKVGEEFLEILIKIFCAVILCIGFYSLFSNIFHQNYINQEIRVSELDKNYTKYKENINQVKQNLLKTNFANSKYDNVTTKKIYTGLNNCLTYFSKTGGLSDVRVGQLLEPYDIYQLNANFNNELYNHCWISNMSFVNFYQDKYDNDFIDKFSSYNRTVNMLAENSDYVKKELAGNSSYHYRTSNSMSMVRNDLMEQYDMVLYNYRVFSDIIAEISDLIVRGDN